MDFIKLMTFKAENLPIAQSSRVVLTVARSVYGGYNYDKMTGGERREEKRSYVQTRMYRFNINLRWKVDVEGGSSKLKVQLARGFRVARCLVRRDVPI